MTMLVGAALLIALATPLGVFHYLTRLPFAPECPRCRGVTEQGGMGAPLDWLLGALAPTTPRRCGRCGWAGRMRWRLAPQPSRRSGAR